MVSRIAGAMRRLGVRVAESRAEELRALRQVIETCRSKVGVYDMPAVSHILRRAELLLEEHATLAEKVRIPRGATLSVSRSRILSH